MGCYKKSLRKSDNMPDNICVIPSALLDGK